MEHTPSPETRQEKERRWQEVKKRLREIEVEKQSIDPGIVEALVGLWVHQIGTSSSCAGHTEIDERPRFPYIRLEAPDRPEYQYAVEKQLKEDIARKYDIQPSEVGKDKNLAADDEYRETRNNLKIKTPEYRAWEKRDKENTHRLMELLAEHHKSHHTPEASAELVLNYNELISTSSLTDRRRTGPPQDIDSRITHIHASQEEFRAFTIFLKNRFFNT